MAVFVRPGAPLRKHMPGVKLSKERRNALAARDALVEANLAWAHQIAANVARVLPTWFTQDDLTGPAELALLEVAARYDPARGVPFQAFAYMRVQGACFSSVRRKEYRERAHASLDAQKIDPGSNPKERPGGTWAKWNASMSPADSTHSANPAEALEAVGIFACVKSLPLRHQRIIILRYQLDLSMDEIGRRMGLSCPRISQLHKEALQMLRSAAEGME